MTTALVHIHGVGHIALEYGLEEAIFLDSIMFWYRTNRGDNKNYHDGRWWTYNSVKAYEEVFPWWSKRQIRRIIDNCLAKGALISGDFNEDRRDRTAWYTPSDELLVLYGEAFSENDKCICQKGQMHLSETASACDQNVKPLPCIDHVYIPPISPQEDVGPLEKKSVPKWRPERFAAFWEYYPRGENKQGAARAWDKLKPSDELIDTMAKALKRQLASEEWKRDIGIPYASTWLNQRRWEDEIKAVPISDSCGWAPDPEVY